MPWCSPKFREDLKKNKKVFKSEQIAKILISTSQKQLMNLANDTQLFIKYPVQKKKRENDVNLSNTTSRRQSNARLKTPKGSSGNENQGKQKKIF